MHATEAHIRELDFRESAGLQVTLLWQAVRNRTWLHVRDARTDDAFTFGVAAVDASDAFNHPFAYAPRQRRLDHWSSLAPQS